MSRTNALVLVDLQNDFCPGGALAVPDGNQVIEIANRLQPHFDIVVATADWHPANHGSFAANHAGKTPGDTIKLGGVDQVLWPVHCVQDSDGAQFVAALDTSRVAETFRKGTDPSVDSYSGFFDNGQKNPSGLAEYLRARAVQDLYILGLATDYCVRFTALDARREGFTAMLIEDGCRGVGLGPTDIDDAIDEMRRGGVAVITSGQITA